MKTDRETSLQSEYLVHHLHMYYYENPITIESQIHQVVSPHERTISVLTVLHMRCTYTSSVLHNKLVLSI